MDFQKHIEEQLLEIDIAQIVKNEVATYIRDDVKRNLSKWTEKKVDALIDTEVEIVLTRPVTTDDGWGKKESFKSFEEMFKQEFHKRLQSTYQIQNLINKAVKDKLDRMFNQKKGEFLKTVKDSLEEVIEGAK